jgi:hypothetical protein
MVKLYLCLNGGFTQFPTHVKLCPNVLPWWNSFLLFPKGFMPKVKFCWCCAVFNVHETLMKPHWDWPNDGHGAMQGERAWTPGHHTLRSPVRSVKRRAELLAVLESEAAAAAALHACYETKTTYIWSMFSPPRSCSRSGTHAKLGFPAGSYS